MVFYLTEWAEFREIDPAALKAAVSNPVVLDTRNCLAADADA